MNPEIWRHILDAIENSAFHLDTRFRVSPADIALSRETSVTDAGTLDVGSHLQPVPAEENEVVS